MLQLLFCVFFFHISFIQSFVDNYPSQISGVLFRKITSEHLKAVFRRVSEINVFSATNLAAVQMWRSLSFTSIVSVHYMWVRNVAGD